MTRTYTVASPPCPLSATQRGNEGIFQGQAHCSNGERTSLWAGAPPPEKNIGRISQRFAHF